MSGNPPTKKRKVEKTRAEKGRDKMMESYLKYQEEADDRYRREEDEQWKKE